MAEFLFVIPFDLNVFSEGALFLDADARVLAFNETAMRTLGISSESLDCHIASIMLPLEPDGVIHSAALDAIHTGELQVHYLKSKDQNHVELRASAMQLPAGVGGGILMTFSGVLRKEKSRRRLERALAAADMAWWEWDLKVGTFDLHAAGECILGYECWRHEFSAEFWFEKTHPDDLPRVRASLDQFLSGEVENWDCQHRFQRGDDRRETHEWVHETAVVVERSPDGEPLKVEGTTRNIHLQKLLELDVLAAKGTAERAVEYQNDVFAVISHELRTPLNGIYGMVQVLESELEDQPCVEDVRLVRNSAEELLVLVDNLIELSSKQKDALTLRPGPCDLHNLVKTALRFVSLSAENKGVRVELACLSSPKHVVIDESRLRQVLTNVIGNAIKFSKEGGTVGLCVEEEPGQDPFLKITIEDKGEGMTTEMRDRAFKPFSQSDVSSTRRHGGAGLGLTVSNYIIHAMGGEIEVESKLNEGTRVTIIVPYTQTSTEAPHQKQEIPHGNTRKSDLPDRNVLVVDRHPASSVVAIKLLERLGLSVAACTGPLDAEQILRVGRYCAVFVDLTDLNAALKLAAALRSGECQSLHQEIPIIGCTSDISGVLGDDRRASVFADLLYKPVRMEYLQRIVGQHIF